MLYDVKQIAEITELSEATIYRKMNLQEMREYIIKKSGKRYLDEQGLEAIQNIINEKDIENDKNENSNNFDNYDNNIDNSVKAKDIYNYPSIEIAHMQELLNAKDDMINNLKDQLEIKDKQLENKDKLLENMQVLLKQEQEQKIPQILANQEDRDIRLVNTLLDTLEKRKQENEYQKEKPKKKGLFGLFKSKSENL